MESATAMASLAYLCVKALGQAAPEAVSIYKLIIAAWEPRAQTFYDAVHSSAVDLLSGDVDVATLEAVIDEFRPSLSLEFIEEAGEGMGRYYRKAYEQGLRVGLRKSEKASAFEELVTLTRAKRKNVVRTIDRWFSTTQGDYFDRFIVPYTKQYTARLREAGGRVGTLNKIGRDYKKFVAAEGYWDTISDFNAHTAAAWAQIDSIHEAGCVAYIITAIIDDRTCVVCLDFDGNVYSVAAAQARMTDMLVMGVEQSVETFPWPRPRDVAGGIGTTMQLNPFHGRCRCESNPIYSGTGAGLIPPASVRRFRKGEDFRGVSNERAIRYMQPCIIKSASSVVTLKEPIDVALSGSCLSKAKYAITDMNLGYDGEYVVRDLLDVPLTFTTHKAAVDIQIVGGLLGKTKKGWGFEVKTQRASSVDHKCRIGSKALKAKEAYVKANKIKPGTFLLVRDEEGLFDIYFKKGHGSFRINAMTHIGKASRKEIWESAATEFAPGVRDALLKAMGEI